VSDAERRAVHIVVHGHVQGVFFRDSLRECAESNGVAGWVTNRGDGAVEALLEGTPDAVAAVLAFARTGPSSAQVRDVEERAEPVQGRSGFQIR
jgi:acylphosphatase